MTVNSEKYSSAVSLPFSDRYMIGPYHCEFKTEDYQSVLKLRSESLDIALTFSGRDKKLRLVEQFHAQKCVAKKRFDQNGRVSSATQHAVNPKSTSRIDTKYDQQGGKMISYFSAVQNDYHEFCNERKIMTELADLLEHENENAVPKNEILTLISEYKPVLKITY